MTEREEKIVRIDNKVDILATKVDAFIQEMRDFKTEMRDRDNQRAAEIQSLRTEMRDRDNQRAEEIKESRVEMANIGRHVRNITIAAMVGIGALALSGGAIAVAVIYSVFNH